MLKESNLVEVRCPLPSMRDSKLKCNKLCVRAAAGSSGKAYCARHEIEFYFEVDDNNTFSDIISRREATQSGQTAEAEHPSS